MAVVVAAAEQQQQRRRRWRGGSGIMRSQNTASAQGIALRATELPGGPLLLTQ